jgi:succinoglycan biosynthesis protein ExoM
LERDLIPRSRGSLLSAAKDAKLHVTAPSTTVIGVPTGGNLPNLRRLLSTLADEYGRRHDVRLLLVDNSEAGMAQELYEACAPVFEDRATYVHEPNRGYANVRNALIRNMGDAYAIAMIDDDELPARGWLDSLMAAQARTGTDIVAGSVVREFPPDAPREYVRSGVFDLEVVDRPEGAIMPWCASHNTLVLARVFERVPEGFNPKFNTMGGEDTHFFMLARRRGCTISWTRTAVVHETLSPDRFTRRWVFQRAVLAGNSRAICELELVPGPSIRLTRAAKTIGLCGIGLASAAVAGLRRDRTLRLRALHRLGLAWGMVLAVKSRDPWAPRR